MGVVKKLRRQSCRFLNHLLSVENRTYEENYFYRKSLKVGLMIFLEKIKKAIKYCELQNEHSYFYFKEHIKDASM
jgi:hypothetical protein